MAALVLPPAEQTTRTRTVARITRAAAVAASAEGRHVGAAAQGHQHDNTVHCVTPPKETLDPPTHAAASLRELQGTSGNQPTKEFCNDAGPALSRRSAPS